MVSTTLSLSTLSISLSLSSLSVLSAKFFPVLSQRFLSTLTPMKNYSWPTTPLKPSSKKKKFKKLLSKLDNVVTTNKDKSSEINTLKGEIIDLLNLDK